jgi:hypothetical protein
MIRRRILLILIIALLIGGAWQILNLQSAKLSQTPPSLPARESVPRVNNAAPAPSPQGILDTASSEEWLNALRQRLESGASAEETLANLQFLLRNRPALALELALKLARSDDERYHWVSTLIGDWAQTDSSAAWSWALQPAHAYVVTGDSSLPSIVLARVARLDPARAVAFAESTFAIRQNAADGSVFTHAVIAHAAIRALLDAGRSELAQSTLEKWARSETAGSIDNAAYEAVALALASRSHTQAGDWLRTLPASSDRDMAIATLAADWMATAPEAAMKWASSFETGGTRNDAMQRVFNRWAEQDRLAATQWLADHEDHPQADQLIANLVNDTTLARTNPENALQWAGIIHDPASRLGAIQQIIADWAQTDVVKATQYVANTESLTPEQRAQLLEWIQKRTSTTRE